MFEPLYSRNAEPGATGEADKAALGRASGAGETPNRYGDVPLGVEAAWPAGTERVAS